ncbi:hypothetical protein DWB85_06730 [Seongchinamella sediminis]|uniref:Uncharacterized protein n=1 Tax=Seongchinamella sediminis TaxID=2283635 RepID=A0A3L7E330_9GAMM|nr:hypothetical protein [Seongchinamella sediminis]RLQ22672.1 hypothetical protein DWB85_06730 [Seongchinamella sediminis]
MNLFIRLSGPHDGADSAPDLLPAQRMVLDYARFLEESAPLPGRIVDQSLLPHPKSGLKAALLLCIADSNHDGLAEDLKAGLLMLAAFQPGVGAQALGTDFAGLDLDEDMLDIAVQLEQEEQQAHSRRAQVRRELQQLSQELDAMEREQAQSQPLTA